MKVSKSTKNWEPKDMQDSSRIWWDPKPQCFSRDEILANGSMKATRLKGCLTLVHSENIFGEYGSFFWEGSIYQNLDLAQHKSCLDASVPKQTLPKKTLYKEVQRKWCNMNSIWRGLENSVVSWHKHSFVWQREEGNSIPIFYYIAL